MRRTICLCLWLAAAASALALTTHKSLSYRRLTTHDGLPQVQTERVWQDSRGYIYIGTLSGFVRYDGRSLQPFLRGRRENIVNFMEVDGAVLAMNFRRQWKIVGDELEMCQVDPERHWLVNNLNALVLPDGYVLLEDENEQHRRLCRITSSRLAPLTEAEVILDDSILDLMTPDMKMYIDSSPTPSRPTPLQTHPQQTLPPAPPSEGGE